MRERTEIGGYRIAKRIGYGGMSTVFEAVDADGLHVALKLMHPHIAADPAARERLRREVRMMQRVKGPYVAQIIDAETDDAEVFLVTELIDGPTLETDVIDAGRYTKEDLHQLGVELAKALESIHAVGVLHRDLKPSNVMMGPEGPVLIDFGIAQLGDDSRLTQTGSLTHTPGFCDPRVIHGDDPDASADWWALAAVLAYAATGVPPFGTGSSPAVMNRVLNGTANLPHLDPVLERAFELALAPELDIRLPYRELLAVIDHPEGGIPAGPWDDELWNEGWEDDAGTVADRPATDGIPATNVLTEPGGGEANGTERVPGPIPPGGTRKYADATVEAVDLEKYPTFAPAGSAPSYPPHEQADEGISKTMALQVPASAEAPAPGQAPASTPVPEQLPAAYPPEGGVVEPYIPYLVEENGPVPLDQIPTWLRQPPRFRLLNFFLWVAVVALGVAYPVPALGLFVVAFLVNDLLGASKEKLTIRRYRRGGPYSGDVGGMVLRGPITFFGGLMRLFASLMVGGFIGYSAAVVAYFVTEESFVASGLLVSLTTLIGWVLGTGRHARMGARHVWHAINPSAGYRVFWILLVIFLAAGAIFAANSAVQVNWWPISVPFGLSGAAG